MHPDNGEIRQKCHEDKQGSPGQTQPQKGNLHRVEARTGSLEAIQRLSEQPVIRTGKLKP